MEQTIPGLTYGNDPNPDPNGLVPFGERDWELTSCYFANQGTEKLIRADSPHEASSWGSLYAKDRNLADKSVVPTERVRWGR